MLLALSNPHDGVCINVVGPWIVLRPMDRPCRRRVLRDFLVGARVCVRLGRIIRVEGDVGRRLALVCHGKCGEVGALLALMCHRLQERKQDD